jgi:hypothetical protein
MKKAFGRSLDDFLPLRDAENNLWHAYAFGADLTPSVGEGKHGSAKTANEAQP